MARPRTTIRWLMVAVALAALGLAALMHPDQVTTSLVVFAFVAVLCVSTLGAILSRNRGFWLGCAVFGWACYLIPKFVPAPLDQHEYLLSPPTTLRELAFAMLHREKMIAWAGGTPIPGGKMPDPYAMSSFMIIATVLTWLVFALLGGVLGHVWAMRGADPDGSGPRGDAV